MKITKEYAAIKGCLVEGNLGNVTGVKDRIGTEEQKGKFNKLENIEYLISGNYRSNI